MTIWKKIYDSKLRELNRNTDGHYIKTSDNESKALWDILNSDIKIKSNKPNMQINIKQ